MAGRAYLNNEGMILMMDGGMSRNTKVGQSASATDSEEVTDQPVVRWNARSSRAGGWKLEMSQKPRAFASEIPLVLMHQKNLLDHSPNICSLPNSVSSQSYLEAVRDDKIVSSSIPAHSLSSLQQHSSNVASLIFYEEVKENWQYPRVLFYSSSYGLGKFHPCTFQTPLRGIAHGSYYLNPFLLI